MATCKECLHYGHCPGYLPSDQDEDVWHYCREGRPDEIPDIDRRCSDFKADPYTQLDIAWNNFKQAISVEFEKTVIFEWMVQIADTLKGWLERLKRFKK